MRNLLLSLICIAGLVVAGCEPEETKTTTSPVPDTTKASASGKGLTLTVDLEKTTFVPGEQFLVSITAANQADKTLVIDAGYAAPYVISVQRNTAKGWEAVKTYPQVARGLMRAWKLPARKTKKIDPVVLIAEPSWPTHEPLRLEVKLNGRDDVAPFVTILIVGKSQQGE